MTGANDLGFWKELSDRFEKETGIRVETVVTGNKDGAAALFKEGRADLITIPAGEATILDLVAEGYATDARPWAKTDLAIVGPTDDPAGVKGMNSAAAAVRRD